MFVSPLCAGIWSCVNSHGACLCCHNCFEFTYATALLYPKVTATLYSLITPGSSSPSTPSSAISFMRREFSKVVTFSTEHSAASHPACLVIDLCVDHHLVEIGASPIRAEQRLNL